MMGGITECCKFCEERYLGCHDHCERYQAAAKEWEERKANIKALKDDEFYIYKVTRIKSESKKRRRK